MINKVIEGNCLEVMKNIPDNSIDLIVTDPPYNLDFSKYDSLTDKTGRKFHHTDNLGWDKKENIDMKAVSIILFKEFDRILKQTGSIVIFGPQEWAYYYYEPAMNNHFNLKCQIIWIKSNPIPQMRHKNYRSAHENIVWFARYNEDKCLFTFNFINQKEMKNVFEYPILGGAERLKDENNQALHPTQKPLRLMEKLIKIHSNESDLVLDPFLGSGTTAFACKMLNRRFIGIEKEEKYVEIARRRIANVPERLTKFLK